MTDNPKPAPKEVLPPELAASLLARASELDAASVAGSTVVELRAAAAEAGISGRAFDAALAEVRGVAPGGRPKPGAPVRRRVRVWAAAVGVAMGVAVLAAGGLFALSRRPVPPEVVEVLPPPSAADLAAGGPTHVVVRSADAGRAVTMGVRRDGPLVAALGVAPGADGRRVGRVQLGGAGGTATTPAALEMSGEPGEITFSAPVGGPALAFTVPGTTTQVRGHAVRLVRDRPGGPLRAEVAPPPTK